MASSLSLHHVRYNRKNKDVNISLTVTLCPKCTPPMLDTHSVFSLPCSHFHSHSCSLSLLGKCYIALCYTQKKSGQFLSMSGESVLV